VKKQRLEVAAGDDVIILEDEKKGCDDKNDAAIISKPSSLLQEPEGSSSQSPLFYLSTVRGLNSQYNSATMSVGIKGMDNVDIIFFNFDLLLQIY